MKKRYRIILSIIGLVESIFLLTIPYLTANLIDFAVSKDIDKLILFSILLGINILMSILVKVSYYYAYSRFQLKLEKELKEELFNSISVKEFRKIKEYHPQQIEILFNEDIKHIVSKEVLVIPNFVKAIAKLVLAIGLLIYYDWKFLLVVLAFGLIGLVGAKIYSSYMKKIHKNVLEKTALTNSFMVESVSNTKLVRAYDAKDNVNKYYGSLLDSEISSKKKRNFYYYGFNSIFYAFSSLIYIGPLLYGAFGIYKEWFTYGVFMALVLLVRQVENPLLQLSGLVNQYSEAEASKDRLKTFIEIKEDKAPIKDIDFDSIIFDDVSFMYEKNHYILKNFNLTINKGDTIFLSGRSGIGKTTLFMLLMGFLQPTSGHIYYEYKGIKKEISMESISLFSYVPQENILFSRSIIDNLLVLTKKDESSIIEALKEANIYDEIMALPNKLDTILSNSREGLSLGQIQRILIAIALLNDGKILLLDEFSSALDKDNENKIISNLGKLNKTIIYITHRENNLENSKKVILEELC